VPTKGNDRAPELLSTKETVTVTSDLREDQEIPTGGGEGGRF